MKLTVCPVTSLAKSASAAPGQPAAYAGRYVDSELPIIVAMTRTVAVGVVEMAVVSALSFGCGPRLQFDATSVSIPQQCGVGASEPIGSYDARCIAKHSGLEYGIQRWKVTRHRGDTVEEGYWSVCNTLTPSDERTGASGRCVDIQVSDGAVKRFYPWQAVRVD